MARQLNCGAEMYKRLTCFANLLCEQESSDFLEPFGGLFPSHKSRFVSRLDLSLSEGRDRVNYLDEMEANDGVRGYTLGTNGDLWSER